MIPRSAETVRSAMFGPDKGSANFVSVAESEGVEDLLVYRVQYDGVSRPCGIAEHHLIVVNVGRTVAADCNVGRATLNHLCEPGNLTVIPANTEWNATMGQGAEMVVAAIPKARLAVSAAANFHGIPSLRPLLRAQNAELLSVLTEMTIEHSPHSADEIAWHTLSEELIASFLAGCAAPRCDHVRGRLSSDAVAAINLFLGGNLDGRVSVQDIADAAGQNVAHFPRLFRRTLHMSPHQYVMRLRLRRAKALIARGCELAEAAAVAGFSDQSHMTHWLRRIYGTTPGRLAPPRASRRNIQDLACFDS
jgi:AraC family transcriptional regulator